MDVLERLNRKFGAWYEGLFGGGAADRELRPRDILRRIVAAMEDNRREGLDGQVYVPNAYILQIAVESQDERDYLRAFLDAEELSSAVRRAMEQHGYRVKGGLDFKVEEMPGEDPAFADHRVHVRCRFDPSIPEPVPTGRAGAPSPSPYPAPDAPRVATATPGGASPSDVLGAPAPARAATAADSADDIEELGTVAAPFGPSTGPALANLVVQSADGRVVAGMAMTAQGASVGRSRRAGNEVVLREDPMVSKRHARIVHENGRFLVYDLGSTNGTYVNGVLIEPGVPHGVEVGDEVQVGETTLLLRPAGEAAEAAPRRIGVVGGGYQLIAGDGSAVAMAADMVVGSAPSCDLVVNASGVSGQHARFTVEDHEVHVEDLNTPGGTYVNGERIPPLLPIALYEGHQVTLGQAMFRLHRVAERGRLGF